MILRLRTPTYEHLETNLGLSTIKGEILAALESVCGEQNRVFGMST